MNDEMAPLPSAQRRVRAILENLEDIAIAALLREIGFELYNREIVRWQILTDVSDELIDRATFEARARVVDRFLAKPPTPLPSRTAPVLPSTPPERLPFTRPQRAAFRARRQQKRRRG